MKIGLLGGTFDPPHRGHLAMAEAAGEHLGLDEVLLLPAHRNPLKAERTHASATDRLEMVTRAIEGHAKVAVCDLDITRGGPSYMVESLMELSMVRPGDYWLILGADALASLPRWKQPEKIARMCRLGVVPRGVHTHEEILAWLPEPYRQILDFVDMPPVEVSSTEIRARIAMGQPVSHWLAPSVLAYIQRKHLYRS